MTVRRVDVAVVGAGIIGLAAGYELVRRGVDVRVFEASRPGAGQSAGRTRIFRHNHPSAELVARAVQARAAWEEWEAALGRRLLGREGVVLAGPEAEEVAGFLREAGTPGRLVEGDAVREVLPIWEPPSGHVLIDELGGTTDVQATIEGIVGALGERLELAEVFAGEGGDPSGGAPARVETSEGVWEAGRVVICAGAGVLDLAPALGVEVPIELFLHARVTFRVRDQGLVGRLAALQDHGGEYGETVYAAPFPDAPFFAVGLSGEGNDVPFGPDRGPATEALVERIVAYATRALPGVEPEPVGVRLCIQTLFPDGRDLVRTWERGRVIVFAGDNLFKFAPLLGRELAERAHPDRPASL